MNADDNRILKTVQATGPGGGGKGCFTVAAIVVIFGLLLMAATIIIKQVGQRQFSNDPYIKANELYGKGLISFQKGNAKEAKELLLKAVDLQRLKEEEKEPGGPDVRANAVTHNSYGLLAVISAKSGDCRNYWKYRKLTEKIAALDWTYVIMDKETKHNTDDATMMKKVELIRDAAKMIVPLEAICPTPGSRGSNGGLPVTTPAGGGKSEKKH